MEVEQSAPSPSTSGSKRRAEADPNRDETTQPADKKPKASIKRPDQNHVPDRAFHGPSGGILSQLAVGQSGPVSIVDAIAFTINYDQLNNVISFWRNTLIDQLYPGQNAPANIVTDAEWLSVIKAAIKSRTDHVQASFSGQRSTYRIPLMRGFELPLAIAEIINGIGIIHIQNAAITLCPAAPAAPADPAARLAPTHQALSRAQSLIMACKIRNFINTGFINSDVSGTAWWALSPRQVNNRQNVVAVDSDTVVIRAIFKEWTPADAVVCAIMQLPSDGRIPNIITGDIYESDVITSVFSARTTYLLQA